MDISASVQGAFRFGSFRLDPTRRAVTCKGAPVKLAERLFDTLHYLVINHGRVVERNELMQAVWSGRSVDENNLSQAVFTLRKLLQQADGGEAYIVTAPGRGYRFAAQVVFERTSEDPTSPPEAPAAAPAALRRSRMSFALAAMALLVALASLGLRPRPAPEIAPPPPFAPPARSVAVLAFDNLTGDPAQEYVSEGLSEQLIDTLASMAALQVAARASSFSFRGKTDTVTDIAHKLNVGALVEGAVRRDGDHLRVTVQLVNAMTGYDEWSKTFDREHADLLHLQSEIAQAVAGALQTTLLGMDGGKLTLGAATQPASFDAFLRGKRLLRTATCEAGYSDALAAFDAALSQDPGFADAHIYRALALSSQGATCVLHDHALSRKLFDQALREADRAVALAPDLGAAHAARGIVLAWGYLDFRQAALEQSRALLLSPGAAEVQNGFAQAQVAIGNLAAAEQAARRAVQLDPMAPMAWFELGRVLFLARNYDAAAAAARHGQAVTDHMPVRLSNLFCRISLMQGHPALAAQQCAHGVDFGQIVALAIADHALGREGEAAQQRARLHAWLGDEGAYLYALIDAQSGQTRSALTWLETAFRLQDGGLVDLKTEPMLDPVRGESRFRALEERLTARRQ